MSVISKPYNLSPSTRSSVEVVADWMERAGQAAPARPSIPDFKTALLRIQLITEENGELAHALGNGDLVKVLDALTDLQVVLDGAYVACGLAALKEAGFAEVMDSNYSKFDPVTGRAILDEAGRVQKGPNYRPPNLKAVLDMYLGQTGHGD